jgi:hypothetical protein
MTDQSIIEDARAAGFDSIAQSSSKFLTLLSKFAQLREARQSSQSEPVSKDICKEIAMKITAGKGVGDLSIRLTWSELWAYSESLRELYAAPQQAIPSGWISVNDAMPEDGTEIYGANIKGEVWAECFDSAEPLGSMVFWMVNKYPLPPLAASFKSASPTAPIESDK